MREKVRDKGRLEHILQCCEKLIAYKDQYVLDDLKDNSLIFYGFVKLVEIIGEAAYMLTKEFRNKHPEVEWRAMEGMRHVLVHGYYTASLFSCLHSTAPPPATAFVRRCRRANGCARL